MTFTFHDRAPIEKVRRLADGRIAAVAKFARSGCYEYAGSEVGRAALERVTIYRPDDEVFSEDAMASFAHKAITLDHPNEPVIRKLEDVNEGIRDAISKTIGIDDPLINDLLGVLIDQVLIRPMIEELRAAGGIGGGVSGILGAIGRLFGGGGPTNLLASTPFGRASGGYVEPGTMYRVNEGASPGRVEGFVPNIGGQIIPLGRMKAAQPAASAGGTVRLIIEEAPGFAAKVRTEATGVAIEVHRQTLSETVGLAVNETMRRARRPTI